MTIKELTCVVCGKSAILVHNNRAKVSEARVQCPHCKFQIPWVIGPQCDETAEDMWNKYKRGDIDGQ